MLPDAFVGIIVYFVHSGLQDESLQVSYHIDITVPIRRTAHLLSSIIPDNDTREIVFGHRNYPPRERGLNLGPLAPEASALTTGLPRFLMV